VGQTSDLGYALVYAAGWGLPLIQIQAATSSGAL